MKLKLLLGNLKFQDTKCLPYPSRSCLSSRQRDWCRWPSEDVWLWRYARRSGKLQSWPEQRLAQTWQTWPLPDWLMIWTCRFGWEKKVLVIRYIILNGWQIFFSFTLNMEVYTATCLIKFMFFLMSEFEDILWYM